MKALVAYFSSSGVTKKLAERLATAVGGDIFEIAPVTPYTSADLDWRNENSRSSVEMKDRACRPAMKEKPDTAPYDVIFVGFPVWWYREPSIIDTFMESADFAGKTVVPFATSGTSGVGDSGKNMQELAPGAKVFEGKRFDARAKEDELKQWAAQWL